MYYTCSMNQVRHGRGRLPNRQCLSPSRFRVADSHLPTPILPSDGGIHNTHLLIVIKPEPWVGPALHQHHHLACIYTATTAGIPTGVRQVPTPSLIQARWVGLASTIIDLTRCCSRHPICSSACALVPSRCRSPLLPCALLFVLGVLCFLVFFISPSVLVSSSPHGLCLWVRGDELSVKWCTTFRVLLDQNCVV